MRMCRWERCCFAGRSLRAAAGVILCDCVRRPLSAWLYSRHWWMRLLSAADCRSVPCFSCCCCWRLLIDARYLSVASHVTPRPLLVIISRYNFSQSWMCMLVFISRRVVMRRLYCLLFFCVCPSVGHAIKEIDELWQQIKILRGVFRTGRNLTIW